jgi:elongation factor P
MGVSDLRPGATIEYQGELYTVVEYTHMFKGRGKAVAQTKLKNLRTGRVISQTLTDADPFKVVRLDERPLQYLYSAGGEYHFMDKETYDQHGLSEEQIGDLKDYLKENMDVTGLFYEGKMIKIELPITVELKVVETPPGVKGDTQSGGEKPAVLETGLEVKVPLFVKEGDIIRVDTRDGRYVERVS